MPPPPPPPPTSAYGAATPYGAPAPGYSPVTAIQYGWAKFAKSPGNAHFLVGESSMAMAENPHIKRADGLVKRAGC